MKPNTSSSPDQPRRDRYSAKGAITASRRPVPVGSSESGSRTSRVMATPTAMNAPVIQNTLDQGRISARIRDREPGTRLETR